MSGYSTGQIAGGVIGAVIGGYLGGYAGAYRGFTIGVAIGTIVDPPEGPVIDQPEHNNTLTVSTWGAFIAELDGVDRRAGNVIRLRKTQRTIDDDEGKGGGSATMRHKVTIVDLDVGLIKGPAVGLLRIWANSELIYDARATNINPMKSDKITGGVRFYPGSETQLPDPLFVSIMGAGNVSADRGLCHVVIEGLNLEYWGNSLPNLQFEVFTAGSVAYPKNQISYSPSGTQYQMVNFNRANNRFYVCWRDNSNADYHIDEFDPVAQTWARRGVITPVSSYGALGWFLPGNLLVDADGRYAYHLSNAKNHRALLKIDLAARAIVGVAGSQSDFRWPYNIESGSFGEYYRTSKPGVAYYVGGVGANELITYIDGFDYAARGARFISPTALVIFPTQASGLDLHQGANFADGVVWPKDVAIDDDLISWFICRHNGDTATIKLAGYSITYEDVAGVTETDANFDVLHDLSSHFSASNTSVDMKITYEAALHSLLIAKGAELILWDIDAEAVTGAALALSAAPQWDNFRAGPDADGIWYLDTTGNQFDRVDVFGWSVEQSAIDADNWGVGDAASRGAYVAESNLVIGAKISTSGNVTSLFLDRAGPVPVPLDEVVSRYCLAAGLTAGDIDVTDLAGENVIGYSVGALEPAHQSLGRLAFAFDFLAVEIGAQIVFTRRTGISNGVISDDDLVVRGNAAKFTETVTPDEEIPRRVSVTYRDQNNDYQENTQSADRHIDQVASVAEGALKYEGVLTDNHAQTIVARKIEHAWTRRRKFAYALPIKHLAKMPGDVWDFTRKGLTHRMEMREVILTAALTLEISAEAASAQVASQDVTGNAVSRELASLIYDAGTDAILLDLPILREDDDRAGFYYAIYPRSDFGAWDGATLLESSDGATFDAISSKTTASANGVAREALGDHPRYTVLDRVNSLTIAMAHGGDDLISVTELAARRGANSFAVQSGSGWEILSAANVTDNGDGTVTLDTFIRGRLSTNGWIAGHAIGDVVVFLDPAKLAFAKQETTAYGSARRYKAMSFSADTPPLASVDFTNTGRIQRQFAPYALRAYRDGSDIKMLWHRRSRYGRGVEFSQALPIGALAENYSVDVKDGAGNVIRTLAASAETVTYTAAQIATDGVYELFSSSGFLTVTNPDAETGDATGWTNETGSLVVRSASPAPYQGSYYFRASLNAASSLAYQNIDLIAQGLSAVDIDAGSVSLRLGWRQIRFAVDNDEGTMGLRFRDGSAVVISEVELPDAQPSSWTLRELVAVIPANTRTVDIMIKGTRLTGIDLDAYFDAITMEHGAGVLADETSFEFSVYQVGDLLGRGLVADAQIPLKTLAV